ncbi:mandelate racemase/muconate lactonizing enzyme family protein [Membranihabitans maritimus]|uniref:mandelate racemase/muconate lactonizing enzyme family protein n=1 Tax=Membranihabitans maritimus TaxID=2904244 RepID=UPI001F26223A|nr:dipeptide epimerase [Membranihabitans maritimus]
MKIEHIEIARKNLKLARPYTIAFKEVTKVENGIVTIFSDQGNKGLGAFNPSHEVVGETLDDAFTVLTNERLGFLIGRDIRELHQLCFEIQTRFKESSSARIGLEIALYDLFTQFLEVPLSFYLGQKIYSKPTSITIGIKNVEETIKEAREYLERKFKILKIKLGKDLEEDIERLVKLREVFGYGMGIIIDANQGYTIADLLQFYDGIKSLDIPLIEQPLPSGKENEMVALPKEILKKIAVDESLLSPGDAEMLVQSNIACGFFNIKLMKCGGISEAIKIGDIACRNGVSLMWGCNDESIISITAALHVAFACPHTKYIDLDGSLDLAEDVVQSGFVLKEGVMSLPDRYGLGLIRN